LQSTKYAEAAEQTKIETGTPSETLTTTNRTTNRKFDGVLARKGRRSKMNVATEPETISASRELENWALHPRE